MRDRGRLVGLMIKSRIILANLHRQVWCLDNRNLTRDRRWASGRLSSGFSALGSFWGFGGYSARAPPTSSAITLRGCSSLRVFVLMRRGNSKICAFCAKKQILMVENALGLFGFFLRLSPSRFPPSFFTQNTSRILYNCSYLFSGSLLPTFVSQELVEKKKKVQFAPFFAPFSTFFPVFPTFAKRGQAHLSLRVVAITIC